MAEGIADAFRAWWHNSCCSVRTLPGVGCEAGHDVDTRSAAAGLAPEGWCYACAILAGDERGGWGGESTGVEISMVRGEEELKGDDVRDKGDCSDEEDGGEPG